MPARTVKIDLKHRPRLADLRPLIAATPTLLEARAATPRVTAAKDLKNRVGYADEFLSDFVVPWPTVGEPLAGDVQPKRLDYTHFSITLSRSRRLALYVGGKYRRRQACGHRAQQRHLGLRWPPAHRRPGR